MGGSLRRACDPRVGVRGVEPGILHPPGVPQRLLQARTWHYCSETCKVADSPSRLKHSSRISDAIEAAHEESEREPPDGSPPSVLACEVVHHEGEEVRPKLRTRVREADHAPCEHHVPLSACRVDAAVCREDT